VDIAQILQEQDNPDCHDSDDEILSPTSSTPVTRSRDLWVTGSYRLSCDDAACGRSRAQTILNLPGCDIDSLPRIAEVMPQLHRRRILDGDGLPIPLQFGESPSETLTRRFSDAT